MIGLLLRVVGLGPTRPQIELLVARSGKWPSYRAAWLKDNPRCAACGNRENVEVHHVMPVSWDPSKELERDNFVTLCPTHHLWIGHLGDWKSRNPDVRKDAADWADKIHARTYPHPTKKPE